MQGGAQISCDDGYAPPESRVRVEYVWHELWFDLGTGDVLAEVDEQPAPAFSLASSAKSRSWVSPPARSAPTPSAVRWRSPPRRRTAQV